MTLILAAIDDSAAALPVLRALEAMARTLGAEPRAIYVREGEHETATAIARHAGIPIDIIDGDPVERIVESTSAPAVEMLVVGARSHRAGRRPSGHVAVDVMTRVRKPVLVVPPDARMPPSRRFQRALIPLEGTADSTAAVAAAIQTLSHAGADIIVVHVFHPETAPRYWDQPAHAHQSWATEFLSRWCDHPGAELRLRSGDAVAAILDEAARDAVDVIALGWSQNMSDDRGRVVREIVGRSDIPVLLLPVLTASDAPGGAEPT